MIASLPMYLFPETRAAHEIFWSRLLEALLAEGLQAPTELTHGLALDRLWSAPDLVLSHICNLPYRLRHREHLTRIAGSDYGLDGCAPGFYRSLFLVRKDHPTSTPEALDGGRMAINAPDSQSGWGAAALWARARGLRFRPGPITGSHEASLAAVLDGRADFAAIDAQTFRILTAHRPWTAGLKVVGATDPSPGMTFVTRAGQDPAPYRAALEAALAALEPETRDVLGIRSFPVLPEEAYDIPLPPDPGDWRM